MFRDDLTIGGLLVPPALTSLIRAGGWVPPRRRQTLLEVFGDEPEQPSFYDLPDLARQNASWQRRDVEEVFGVPIEGESLGIEPSLSILIADLGIDMPIALDYRDTAGPPPVLYLTFSPEARWIKVASGIEALIGVLYADEK
ncbi:hypothetical protein AB0C33_49635 [Nonomuraea sp. NPDC048881]|uniref:hypothetical protein n=1 Tax=Nonomuraea sp. NPDC048881 TaxID=3155030 RepID=UPI003403FD4C